MNSFSWEVTFSLYMHWTYHIPSSQPPNFTQVLLQPSSTRLWPKPHPPINKLATVMADNRLPKLGKSLSRQKWVPCRARGLFSQPVPA